VRLHRHNHQLLKHQFSNSTIYFVVSKFTLENMNGMREMPKLKPKTTHAHKKFHQTGVVQNRGFFFFFFFFFFFKKKILRVRSNIIQESVDC
jgi:hypothetical protein